MEDANFICMQTTILKVVGTYYYQASHAFSKGRLAAGTSILLIADKNNTHDQNAVAVFTDNYEFKLGHLSRDYAEKYQKLILQNKIISCKVYESFPTQNSIKLKISVTYDDENNSQNAGKTYQLPSLPGVYKIQAGTSRQYIGSTKNLKKRWDNHLSRLRAGNHSNKLLQTDFETFGEHQSKFEIILFCEAEEHLIHEAQAIKLALSRGLPLYNMTSDGKGYITSTKAQNLSISDRSRSAKTVSKSTPKPMGKQIDNSPVEGTNKNYLETKRLILDHYKKTEINRIKEDESISEALSDGFMSRFRTATLKNPGYRGRSFIFGKFGFGRLVYTNGDCYAGNFKRDKKSGHGTYRWSNGHKYVGHWKNDDRTGLGVYSWNTGEEYTGEWLDGKRHGIGRYKSQKEEYWGIWQHGKLASKIKL